MAVSDSLTPEEADAAVACMCLVVPRDFEKPRASALDKMGRAAKRPTWVPFTRADLVLMHDAASTAAQSGDLVLSPQSRRRLCRIADRLADAAGLSERQAPRLDARVARHLDEREREGKK